MLYFHVLQGLEQLLWTVLRWLQSLCLFLQGSSSDHGRLGATQQLFFTAGSDKADALHFSCVSGNWQLKVLKTCVTKPLAELVCGIWGCCGGCLLVLEITDC